MYKIIRSGLFDLFDLISNIKNWYSVILFKYGILKKATFITKNNTKAEIKTMSDYYDFFNSSLIWWNQKLSHYGNRISIQKNVVIFDDKIKFIYHNKEDFSKTMHAVHDVFLSNEYKVGVNNKNIVDIGANIGDTALYFMSKGANSVVGFELFPNTFEVAQENIKLNDAQKNIKILNFGVDGSKSEIFIHRNVVKSNTDNINYALKNKDGGLRKKVKIITLEDIIERFGKPNQILKIDCEGCEYGIILKSKPSVLRSFEEIILEYHGDSRSLEERLSNAGFEVEIHKNIMHARLVNV